VPEGPEIHRAADRLRRGLAGRVAERVFFAFDHLKPFEELLAGEEVTDVGARGKALLTSFANGLVVYSHNQLYGRWWVMPAGRRPRTGRTLRFAVENGERSALLYSASEIDVLDHSTLDAHPYLAALGPDALDPAVDVAAIDERLASRAFRGRALGALLLDQGFVAGIGNYLRSDLLFDARLHPSRRAASLDPGERRRLAESVLGIARRAYATGGVTNEPARVSELRAVGATRRHYRHLVFAREGAACWACATPIRRTEVASRRLYWCPTCQKSP
jgi:endonuclease-8